MQHTLPDVLASRYASTPLRAIWSAEARVLLERELWIAVMHAQREQGLPISAEQIQACEQVKDQVDLESIRRRERVLRHDLKARIEEFAALAGHERIHLGMTSRDLTDNVEQLQLHRSLTLLLSKSAAAILRLAETAQRYRAYQIVARTHNVPAQPTTWGRRLAMFGEEALRAHEHLETLAREYPLRGLKGAVGTQADLQALLQGDAERVVALEQALLRALGYTQALNAVGQVYPRSMDFALLSALHGLSAAFSSLALTLRLMCGHGLLEEGFAKTQSGSSAMPHKRNARTCERICGLHIVVGGFLEMTARLAGSQWQEGDVSCSVVRRVALPGAVFALDGLLEASLTVLQEMTLHEDALEAELRREMPFLATGTLLAQAVLRGMGREAAHARIREHTLAAAAALRASPEAENPLPRLLGEDMQFPLRTEEIHAFLADAKPLLGRAEDQVMAFCTQAHALKQRYPQAEQLRPQPIL